MAMAADQIEALIKTALPDAEVTITDLAGDGDHYAAHVVSATFLGKMRVAQHKRERFADPVHDIEEMDG